MKKIWLSNRNGALIYLERVGRRTFKMCGDMYYTRIIGEGSDIVAVDPPGGPYLCVGGKVAGMTIESIKDDGENIFVTVREKEEIKVIFLDIDGVLTSEPYTRQCIFEYKRENLYGLDWFDPKCTKALRQIIDSTGAVIVISSSWRDLGREKLLHLWEELKLPGELYGTTPEWVLTKREAIEQWLQDNEWDKYVIVDDADLKMDNSFKTNPASGLSEDDANKIIDMLK